MSESVPPPFGHMATTPPRATTLRIVKPAPVSREEVRALAAATAAAEPSRDEPFQMPVMPPPGLPAFGHLRKPRTTAIVSVKAAEPTRATPIVREVESIGTVAGAQVDSYIER